jgi:hypothetical protein
LRQLYAFTVAGCFSAEAEDSPFDSVFAEAEVDAAEVDAAEVDAAEVDAPAALDGRSAHA